MARGRTKSLQKQPAGTQQSKQIYYNTTTHQACDTLIWFSPLEFRGAYILTRTDYYTTRQPNTQLFSNLQFYVLLNKHWLAPHRTTSKKSVE